jgi:hypothetical protein
MRIESKYGNNAKAPSMLRLLFIPAFLLFGWISTSAQYVRPDNQPPQPQQQQAAPAQKPYSFLDHSSIGGDLSLNFGTITYVVLAPLFNYHIDNFAIIGIGPYYQYYSEQEPFPNYSASIYGGRAVAMLFLPAPAEKFYLQGEYDILDVPDVYSPLNNARTSVAIPLVGAGYRQPAGNRCYTTIAILFDLSNSPLSPYFVAPHTYQPIFTAGIDIGL